MKKIAILAVILSLLLCACGTASAPAAIAAPTTAPATTAAPETTAPPETTAAPEETDAPTEPVNEKLELALTFIDRPLSELIDAIGEPESSDYAKSCLGAGDDGNLYYDGFIVYTYREGDEETVRFVE